MGPGVMNIQVRVLAANARRTLRGFRAEMAAVQAQSASTAAVSPVGKRSFADMTKSGNQMQWVGRQLQYNFTLPLLLAAGAATKFQLDQEKAMVHVAKVYGDTAEASKYWGQNTTSWMKGASSATEQAGMVFNRELKALDRNFEVLSVRYAEQKKDVLEVAGAWAAAGVSGKELAKSTENTLIASAVGDMKPAKATEALIAIQAQYNMSAGKLKRTLADLNAIENATAVDMGGLIASMAKSGSAAAASGTSAQYLAAMTASITPAAGSAAQAGNALKTILSRINKPTEEAAAAMERLGINSASTGWKALSGAEKLEVMQRAFNNLSKSEQLANASAIVGIYQYNRMIQLLKDMGREHGNYNKALDATSDKDKVFATLNKELNTILESNPKRLQRMGIALQNSLADIIQPLIPQMIYLAQQVSNLAKAFQQLPAGVQKAALFFTILLVTLPLLLRYMGSVRTLIVVTRVGFMGLARALGIFSTATVVDTVIQGKATQVTEVRRRGLIGLFLTMLRAPFRLFGAMAQAGLGMASRAFLFLYSAGYAAISWLITRMLPMFAQFIASMVSGWWFGAKQQATAAVFGEATSTTATSVGTRTRIAITTAAAKTMGLISKSSAGTQISTETIANARIVTMREAFYSWLLGQQRAYLVSRFALETAASSRMIALEATTSTMTTAIVVRGTVTEVAAISAGATAKVGIIGRMSAVLVGLYTLMGARLRMIWSATLAFLMNPTRILVALGSVAAAIGAGATAIVGALLSPWVIAIAAIIGLLYAFRGQITQIWNNIVSYFQSSGDLGRLFDWMVGGAISAFNALPTGVQNALTAVVKIVRAAALAIYDWFSYINPFARHSPSLVDNVTFGMAEVVKQFSTLGQIKKYTDGAYKELNKFGSATAGITGKAQNVQIADDRKTLKKGGASNEALKSYDALQGKLKSMRATYARMGSAMDAYAKKDIVARRRMENAIFANTFAQKKLRLELLGMEATVGTLDDVRQKLADIAGEQEILRGTQEDLRNAGAGSDILSYYDDQLSALNNQKSTLQDAADQMQVIDDRMKNLQLAGEKLDLEKAMKFDKIDYRLEKMREQYDLIGTSISDIESGINAAVSAQSALNSAAAAGGKKGARDSANRGGKSSKALKAAGVGAGGGADFPSVTGGGMQGRSDWKDQTDAINKLTDQQIKKTSNLFAEVNPFKSLGGWFKRTWSNDVQPKLQAAADWTGNFFGAAFKGVKMPDLIPGKGMGDVGGKLTGGISKGLVVAKKLFDLFWPDIKRIFTSGWNALKPAFDEIGSALAGFSDLWPPIKDALRGVGKVIAIVATVYIAWLIVKLKFLASILGHTIGPIIETVSGVITGLLGVIKGAIRIIAGFVKVVAGILTLDPKMLLTGLGDIGKGIWEIFQGVGKIIWSLLKGAFKIAIGIVVGFVGAFIALVRTLFNLLPGPIQSGIMKVIGFFKLFVTVPVWIWQNVLWPIVSKFASFFVNYILPIVSQWARIILTPLMLLAGLGIWIWKNVLWPIVKFFYRLFRNYVIPFLGTIWGKIKSAWGGLTTAGTWINNNVLKPVGRFFGGLWSNGVQKPVSGLWGKVKGAFGALKSLGKWIWDNALYPAVKRFRDFISNVGKWISDNVGKIATPIGRVVNKVISAINKMIDGINALSKLPGINWNINHIPSIKLAQGGQIPNRKVGNGWVTNGARAIVGEGKANHPEYVVPTDPTHRGRAISLWKSLGQRIGALDSKRTQTMDTHTDQFIGKTPAYGIGGILDDIKNKAGGVTGGVKDGLKKGFDFAKSGIKSAASFVYKPFGKIIDSIIGKIKWEYARRPPEVAHDKLKDYIKGADSFVSQVVSKEGGGWRKVLGGAYSIGGGIGSYKGHNGQDFPTATGSNVYAASKGKVTVAKDLTTSYGKYIKIAHSDGIESLYAHNSKRLVSSGDNVRAGQKIALSGSTGNSTGPHLHLSMWDKSGLRAPLDLLRSKGVRMAKGGVVRARSGGVDLTAGEAGRDEAVIPLPRDWKSGKNKDNGNTYNFYGDLEFPNITSGDDAGKFLDNLESVVKD